MAGGGGSLDPAFDEEPKVTDKDEEVPRLVCENCGFEVSLSEAPLDRFGVLKGTLNFKCPSCNHKFFIKKSELGEELYNDLRGRVRLLKEKTRREEKTEVKPPVEEEVYKTTSVKRLIYEIASSGWLGLSEAQIKELMDIVDDYGGYLTPSDLERILNSFDRVSREKAKIARERYEMKLRKEWENLPAGVVESLGISPPERYHYREPLPPPQPQLSADALRDAFKKAFSEVFGNSSSSMRGILRSDPYAEHVAPALGKALMNVADSAGMFNRFFDRVILTAMEEQVRRDPYLIGDLREILPAIFKGGKREEEEERVESKGKVAGAERKERWLPGGMEEGGGKVEEEKKHESIFSELDEYFEEE